MSKTVNQEKSVAVSGKALLALVAFKLKDVPLFQERLERDREYIRKLVMKKA
jgi:hypothetical protein